VALDKGVVRVSVVAAEGAVKHSAAEEAVVVAVRGDGADATPLTGGDRRKPPCWRRMR